ncbi:MAG: hypothetical protein ACK4UK_08585 [Flavobacterium sp.]
MLKPQQLYYVFFLLLIQFSTSAQCAMCRAVLESEEGSQQAEAINNGIVYLMIFPYLLVGIVFYVVYKMKFPKEKKAAS